MTKIHFIKLYIIIIVNKYIKQLKEIKIFLLFKERKRLFNI